MNAVNTMENSSSEKLAYGLGWFSIALGLAELCGPRVLARWIGIEPRKTHTQLLRVLGARELANGVAILLRRRSPSWVWTRVAGDAMDLALLVAAFKLSDAQMGRLAAVTTAVAGVTALDVLCGRQLSQEEEESVVEIASAPLPSTLG